MDIETVYPDEEFFGDVGEATPSFVTSEMEVGPSLEDTPILDLGEGNVLGTMPSQTPDFSANQDYKFGPYGGPYTGPDFSDHGSFISNENCSEHLIFALEMKKFFSTNQLNIPIVYCVISLIGLIGNGLVMFVIIGSKEMTKTVANIYILNLAIADTLFLVTLPFVATQRVLLSWPFGVSLCKITEGVKHLNIFASVFFLTAMSVDRYFAVVYVVASNKYRTNKNTFLVCGMIWLFSLIMVIPLLVYTDVKGELCRLMLPTDNRNHTGLDLSYDGGMGEGLGEYYPGEDYNDLCDFLPPLPGDYEHYPSYGDSSGDYTMNAPSENSTLISLCKNPESKPYHVYIISSFIVGFLVPFCVITVCYVMIIARLAQSSETAGTRSKQAERTRRKVTRMVVALVMAFFICWLPFHVLHILQIPGIKVKKETCRKMKDFTFCLGFGNSCLNPILYTFLGHNFQERLRKSIALSLRSFSFSNFTKYTTNHTMSRGDTGGLTKKDTDHPGTLSRLQNHHPLSQLPEEEPCIQVDTNDNIAEKV